MLGPLLAGTGRSLPWHVVWQVCSTQPDAGQPGQALAAPFLLYSQSPRLHLHLKQGLGGACWLTQRHVEEQPAGRQLDLQSRFQHHEVLRAKGRGTLAVV